MLTVRDATAADAEALSDLWNAAVPAIQSFTKGEVSYSTADDMRRAIAHPEHEILVCEDGGELVGYFLNRRQRLHAVDEQGVVVVDEENAERQTVHVCKVGLNPARYKRVLTELYRAWVIRMRARGTAWGWGMIPARTPKRYLAFLRHTWGLREAFDPDLGELLFYGALDVEGHTL